MVSARVIIYFTTAMCCHIPNRSLVSCTKTEWEFHANIYKEVSYDTNSRYWRFRKTWHPSHQPPNKSRYPIHGQDPTTQPTFPLSPTRPPTPQSPTYKTLPTQQPNIP